MELTDDLNPALDLQEASDLSDSNDLNQSASDLLSQLEKRQDWVLEELDLLDARIEEVLKAYGRPSSETREPSSNTLRTNAMA